MKTITIYQPWASLLACGAKQYETRSWKTEYRGEIAIHSALKDPHSIMLSLPFETSKTIYDSLYERFNIQSGALNEMPTGCIVATAELINCWEIHCPNGRGASLKDVFIDKHDSNDPDGVTFISEKEFIFGDFTTGRYAWEFVNMKMLDVPIIAKGKQRLWNWDN